MVFKPSRAPLRVIAVGISALCLSPSPALRAQAPDLKRIDQVLDNMPRAHSVQQLALSPDGKRLAWVEHAKEGVEIRIAPIENLKKSQRVTAAEKSDQHCQESDPLWSPDGKSLTFFSDCAKPIVQPDLYISQLDGSPARRLTELKGYVDSPAFSPDGSRVAFLYVEGATRPAGALAAMKPFAGVIGEDGVEIERLAFANVQAPAPVPPTFATPATLHVYEFDWRPDSKGFAYIAADPPGENNWWVARLYTQELNQSPVPIFAPADDPGPMHGLQIAVPRWSPDAKSIAFIGGLMSDQGATGGDLWTIPAAGGSPRNLTPARPTSIAWIDWDGNRHIYLSELAGGDCRLVRLALPADPSGAPSFDPPVYSVPGAVGDGRFMLSVAPSADHSVWAFHASTFDHAPEIYIAHAGTGSTAGLDTLTQLSHLNEDVTAAWGKSVSLAWTSDRFHVQGWLMLPKNYNPARKYPLIVEVHGGPASAVVGYWRGGGSLSPAVFSALGYFVLQPNPRGSYGQGEAFTKANRKDFGYGDLRDILAGVDAAEAQYSIDPSRVGLTGWSYGGFMSMFAVTQTTRFRAAVAGAGISDWLSYYGENSIDQWMTPYFGASVYDDPAVYARSSAINFIKKVKTPTLVVVGDRDGECPAPQSFEFWHALRAEHVPTQLVVYPNEGHGFVDPDHRHDVMVRAIEWFDHYMQAGQ